MANLNFDDLNITSQDDDILNEDETLAGTDYRGPHYTVFERTVGATLSI